MFVSLVDCIHGVIKINKYQTWQLPEIQSGPVKATITELNPEEAKASLAYDLHWLS